MSAVLERADEEDPVGDTASTLERKENIAAIVLAAGRSVRFRSARSKLTHPLGGQPLIHWPLATLRELGADPIVVVVGPHAEALEELCGAGVVFAYQVDPRGTGHAALMTAPILEEFPGDILILNGDVPFLRAETLRQLVEAHGQSGGQLTLATAVLDDPHGWGRIVRNGGAVSRIVEERDTSPAERDLHEVNVGLYCVASSVLFPLLEKITPDNVQGELYLTDLVEHALASGVCVRDVRVDAAEVAQVNSRGELATMERTLRMRISATWMEAGVTIEDPETTYIEPGVIIGRDTVIGPNVQLKGRTAIGTNCRLDGTALLRDARLGDDVHVKLGVVIDDAEVGHHCQIGPFAHLRPGSRLGDEVHIGNFVETKKTTLAARAKANHLAYLGDAEIGSETNVGAGTITCNYDGFRKHRSVVGERVQIGSDTQLVAPVTVGDDAYIATGTTVREDVPPGALVFNRKEDIHREGWVAGWRARQMGDAGGESGTGSSASTAKDKRVAKKSAAGRKPPPRLGGAKTPLNPPLPRGEKKGGRSPVRRSSRGDKAQTVRSTAGRRRK
jgi:bifunctional UDP-N-acetylglucosamine pyrophosphorylase / glucosamine-1-phosphate N-acetyltransferase